MAVDGWADVSHFLGVLGLMPDPIPIRIAVAVAREKRGDEEELLERGLPVYLGLFELFVLEVLDIELLSMLVMLLWKVLLMVLCTMLAMVLTKWPWVLVEELLKLLLLRLLPLETMLPLLYVQLVPVLPLLIWLTLLPTPLLLVCAF
jgi:hypothetical protein